MKTDFQTLNGQYNEKKMVLRQQINLDVWRNLGLEESYWNLMKRMKTAEHKLEIVPHWNLQRQM